MTASVRSILEVVTASSRLGRVENRNLTANAMLDELARLTGKLRPAAFGT